MNGKGDLLVISQDPQKPFIYLSFSDSDSHGVSKTMAGALIFHFSSVQVFPSLNFSTL